MVNGPQFDNHCPKEKEQTASPWSSLVRKAIEKVIEKHLMITIYAIMKKVYFQTVT